MTNVSAVYFGKIEAMVAEVSALVMPDKWHCEHGHKYAVVVVGEAQYDTDFCKTVTEARSIAKEQAKALNVKVVRI